MKFYDIKLKIEKRNNNKNNKKQIVNICINNNIKIVNNRNTIAYENNKYFANEQKKNVKNLNIKITYTRLQKQNTPHTHTNINCNNNTQTHIYLIT